MQICLEGTDVRGIKPSFVRDKTRWHSPTKEEEIVMKKSVKVYSYIEYIISTVFSILLWVCSGMIRVYWLYYGTVQSWFAWSSMFKVDSWIWSMFKDDSSQPFSFGDDSNYTTCIFSRLKIIGCVRDDSSVTLVSAIKYALHCKLNWTKSLYYCKI